MSRSLLFLVFLSAGVTVETWACLSSIFGGGQTSSSDSSNSDATTLAPTTPTTTRFAGAIFPTNCGANLYQSSDLLTSRIVGGVNSKQNEFPFQVRLSVSTYSGDALCGGSIISDRLILTAAHCVATEFTKITAYFADYELNKDDPGEFSVETDKAIVHPQYSSDTHDNDFAIVILPSSAALNFDSLEVQPICLPTSCDNGAGLSNCTYGGIIGWGANAESNQVATNILQKAAVPFVSTEECNNIYSSGYGIDITQNMICAGAQEGGIDTCQGDSGGPLFCKKMDDSGHYHLVGVTSFGIGCARAGLVGVYSYVCKAYPWIYDVAYNMTITAATTAATTTIKQSGGDYVNQVNA